MAAGAVPVSASVRSVFCVPGPPTRASGTADAQVVAEPVDELRGGLAVDGGGRSDPDHAATGSGGLGDDGGGDDAGFGGGDVDHPLRLRGGGGDEQRGGCAGAEVGDDGVVAVAALRAPVDHPGRRHPQTHAERGGGQEEEQAEAGGQGGAGSAHRGRGPAGPFGVIGLDRSAGGGVVGHGQAELSGDLVKDLGLSDGVPVLEQLVPDREVERFTDVEAVVVREGGGPEDDDRGRRERGRVESREEVASDLRPQVGDFVGDLGRLEGLAIGEFERPAAHS